MQGSDLFIVYAYSYFPALILALFFWWMDRFEREPLILIVAIFFWGAFGAGSLSGLGNTLIHSILDVYQITHFEGTSRMTAVIVAPFVEEFFKGVILLVLLRLGKIDNMTDGLLMGLASGLGFAASENVFYALENVYLAFGELAMWQNLWFREIHTTLLHGVASAVLGALIGFSRQVGGFKKLLLIFNGYLLAIAIHGFWNFMSQYRADIKAAYDFVELIIQFEIGGIFVFLVILFVYGLRSQSQMIIDELFDEHQNGVLPFEHISFFASLIRHSKRYQLPKTVSPSLYAQWGVRLAFRKYEYKKNPSQKLMTEIESLRQKIKVASGYEPDSLKLIYGQSI